MCIVEVAYNWPVEVFIRRHLEAMSAKGQPDIAVVVRHKSAEYAGSASVEGYSIIDADEMPNFDHLSRLEKWLALGTLFISPGTIIQKWSWRDRVLFAYFRRLRPGLIHFHAVSLAVMMAWIPEALGIPYTLSLRGSDIQVEPLRSPENCQMIAKALRRAAGIHAVCGHLGRRAAVLAPDASPAITIYTTLPVPDALPEYAPLDDGRLHLVTTGRIHWTKDYPDLLLALRVLLDQGVDADLTLIGSGPDKPRLEFWQKRLGLENRLNLAGKAGFAEIRILMARSHAYVQSSLAEGFSNSLAEAMAWGCPVFATSVGGTAELVRDGESGYILPPLEPEAWPERLRLALDRPCMVEVRARAHQVASEHFSPRLHAEHFSAFYRQARETFKPLPQVISLPSNPAAEACEPRLGQPHILIWGPWQWQYGADLVLRALGKLASRNFSLCLSGSGEQKDELVYLLDLLGLLHLARLDPIPEQAVQDPELRQARLEGASLVVDISRAGWWQVSIPGDSQLLSFADAQSLTSSIGKILGM